MVSWSQVVQSVETHTQEFIRIHKCLNKENVPKSPTRVQHLDNIILEYNAINKIFSEHYPNCNQAHKLEIIERHKTLHSKLTKLFTYLNIQTSIPTSFHHLLFLNPARPPAEENNSFNFNFDFDFYSFYSFFEKMAEETARLAAGADQKQKM